MGCNRIDLCRHLKWWLSIDIPVRNSRWTYFFLSSATLISQYLKTFQRRLIFENEHLMLINPPAVNPWYREDNLAASTKPCIQFWCWKPVLRQVAPVDLLLLTDSSSWSHIMNKFELVAGCPAKHFFCFGSDLYQLKHQAVSVMFWFVTWNYKIFVLDPELKQSGAETNRNRPKRRSARQKIQITAKQSKTNRVKTKKVGEQGVDLCYCSCFTSKVVGFRSTKTSCSTILRNNRN